jgi:hypothetical protein
MLALWISNCTTTHSSLAGRITVVRCDNLPPAVNVHPDIGETVVIFVGLTFGDTFFVIRASDDSRVAMHSDEERSPILVLHAVVSSYLWSSGRDGDHILLVAECLALFPYERNH